MFTTTEKKKRREGRRLVLPSINGTAERWSLFLDIGALLLGLLFSGTHAVFGAYPLSVTLIAVLPSRIWYAVVGSALGALTLGKSGFIYGMIYVILGFLRLIARGGVRDSESSEGARSAGQSRAVTAGDEGLMLRVAVAVIGGFIAAVYELLLSGVGRTALLFALGMLLLPPIGVLLLAGLFDRGLKLSLLFGKDADAGEAVRSGGFYFKLSFLSLAFLVSLSLSPYAVLGVSLSLVLSASVALWVGYTMGPLYGCAVGFASALGHSGALSAAFALIGLASGALFKLGTVYGAVGGGAAALLFCAYTGGMEGFLSVLPEYLVATAVATPLLRRAPKARSSPATATAQDEPARLARDMVGVSSLSFRNTYRGSMAELESSLGRVGECLKRYCRAPSAPTEAELCELIFGCIENYLPTLTRDRLGEKRLTSLAGRLAESGRLGAEELSGIPELSEYAEPIARSVTRGLGILRKERYEIRSKNTCAEDFELTARLVAQGRALDEEERGTNEDATARVQKAVADYGIADASCLVLGLRRYTVYVAAPDSEGVMNDSSGLVRAIETVLGARLSPPELTRRDKVAMICTHSLPTLVCDGATAGACCEKEHISGDSWTGFTTPDGRYYSILCDGEGSGEQARRVADFVSDFMGAALPIGDGAEATLGILNKMIRTHGEDRSVTLDLFGIDLYTGEAGFIKSGAATSYVKRGESIFRISSRTTPLGLTAGLDAEHVRVGVSAGSYVIMLSDGIAVSTEECGWFLELLAEEPRPDPKAYAEHILSVCLKHLPLTDDCTVAVVRVCAAGSAVGASI